MIATGGVYLAGGIAPQIVERLKSGPFLTGLPGQGPDVRAALADPGARNHEPRRGSAGAGRWGARGAAGAPSEPRRMRGSQAGMGQDVGKNPIKDLI